jgi:hypothetical protein
MLKLHRSRVLVRSTTLFGTDQRPPPACCSRRVTRGIVVCISGSSLRSIVSQSLI